MFHYNKILKRNQNRKLANYLYILFMQPVIIYRVRLKDSLELYNIMKNKASICQLDSRETLAEGRSVIILRVYQLDPNQCGINHEKVDSVDGSPEYANGRGERFF